MGAEQEGGPERRGAGKGHTSLLTWGRFLLKKHSLGSLGRKETSRCWNGAFFFFKAHIYFFSKSSRCQVSIHPRSPTLACGT